MSQSRNSDNMFGCNLRKKQIDEILTSQVETG